MTTLVGSKVLFILVLGWNPYIIISVFFANVFSSFFGGLIF